MIRKIGILLIALSFNISVYGGERWSRQITNEGFPQQSSGNEWIPLTRSGDRGTAGRVLNFNPLPHHQPPYVPHVFQNNEKPQQSFEFAGEAFSSPRFLVQQTQQQHPVQYHQQPPPPPPQQPIHLQQPQFQQQQFVSQVPLEQQNHFQFAQPGLVGNQPKSNQHNFQFHQQHQQQLPQMEALMQSRPVMNFPPQEEKRAKNYNLKPIQQQSQNNIPRQEEEVQLLYVPLDTLYQQNQQMNQFQNNRYNVLPPVNPAHINDFYSQEIQKPYTTTTQRATTIRVTTTQPPTTTTARINPLHQQNIKPKPHQPPLAMFMKNIQNKPKMTINEVLTVLKNERTIAVLDSASRNAPNVFIGPSGLQTPIGYSKYDLPYLNSIESNRFERKVQKLPFFVAPQSYRAPDGFAKIPLPAPHVGSIVVNTPQTIEQTTQNYQEYSSYFPIQGSQGSQVSQGQFATSSTERPYSSTGSSDRFKYNQPQEPTRDYFTTELPQRQRARPQSALKSYQITDSQNINDEFYNIRKLKPIHKSTYQEDEKINHRPEKQTERPYVSSTRAQEEYRMKSYFKEQDAFKKVNAPAFTSSFPQQSFQYSSSQAPVSYEPSERPQPSSTHNPIKQEEFTSPKPQQDFTYNQPEPEHKFRFTNSLKAGYSISSDPVSPNEYSTLAPREQYNSSPNPITISSSAKPIETEQQQYFQPEHQPPVVHHYTSIETIPKEAPTSPEESSYQLPSELPPISPSLPGLINSLMEEHKEVVTTTLAPITSTRRTLINRGRRPATRKPIETEESSTDHTVTITTTRRPIQRGRRPTNYTARNPSPNTVTPRVPSIRNPHRVRYNPTSEERQQRGRTRGRTQNIPKTKEEDNLEYQRDVLNQNYPVIKPINPTTIATETLVQNQATESEQVVSISSTNYPQLETEKPELFVGLQEPMQVPQEYQIEKTNSENGENPPVFYGDRETNEKVAVNRQEHDMRPVYVQSSTETPITTTAESFKIKRPSFVKRPQRPLYTTTQPSVTTITADDAKFTVRSRTRSENSSNLPKISKIRGRTRKPATSSTTVASETEGRKPYRKSNRRPSDYYNTESSRSATTANDESQTDAPSHQTNRFRQRSRFALETQESQWSPTLTQNSFQPIESDHKGKSLDLNDTFQEPETEIVTAGTFGEEESYLLNVSAGIGPSFAVPTAAVASPTEVKENVVKTEEKNSTSESPESFADMIEEFMSDFTNNDLQKKQEDSNEVIPASSNIDNENKKQGRRRGAWRRVRVRPVDTFETAESQNIGRQIYNTIAADNNKHFDDFELEKVKLNEKPYFENENSVNEAATNFPTKEEDVTTTLTPEIVTEIVTEIPEELQNETITPFIEEERDEVTTTPEPKSEEILEVTTIPSTNETATEIFDEYFDFDSENREGKAADEDSQEEPSMFDEVKKQLSDLFAMGEIDEERESMNSQNLQYTTIQRNKAPIEEKENEESAEDETTTTAPTTTTTTSVAPPTSSTTEISPFSKDYFGNLILATSTSTEVSHETEICYRGRCVKTEDKRG